MTRRCAEERAATPRAWRLDVLEAERDWVRGTRCEFRAPNPNPCHTQRPWQGDDARCYTHRDNRWTTRVVEALVARAYDSLDGAEPEPNPFAHDVCEAGAS